MSNKRGAKLESGAYSALSSSDAAGGGAAEDGVGSGPGRADSGGCLSRLLMLWTSAVTRIGYRRPLQPEDLWGLPEAIDPALMHAQFVAAWEIEASRPRPPGKPVNMFRVFWRVFRRDFIVTGLMTVLLTASQFGAPTFIGGITHFAEQHRQAAQAAEAAALGGVEGDVEPTPSVATGLALALGMLAAQVSAALFGAHASFGLARIGVRSRAMLSGAVCRHALKLTAEARE
jgi:hypothetical protein